MKNRSLVVKGLVSRLLIVLLAMTVLSPTPTGAAIRLDTNDISNFTQFGQPPSTSMSVLKFSDPSPGDVSALVVNDPDAAPGGNLDLRVSFQVRSTTPNGADGGFSVVINDGQSKAAIATCAVLNNQRVIALRGPGQGSDAATYPVFVVVDWLVGPVALKLRRWADGSAEILKVNEASPNPRVFLQGDQVPGRTRTGATVEFGCFSVEGLCDADVTQFSTEIPVHPQAIVPVIGVTPTLTPVTINASAGDQYDPHISGDWISYTSDLSIRYYNFATDTDAAVPMGISSRDLLSDVSGGKIVFSRVITGVKTAMTVFDAATPAAAPIEIDPTAGTTRIGAAIGGNTVAYMDFGLEAHGELVIHDLTSNTSVRITSDTAYDQNPSVSPDGNVVTWEHAGTSTSNGDIWQAVKSGAGWNVSVASDSDTLNAGANTFNPEANPDSNGTLVVYDSTREVIGGQSQRGIFWRPVAGGAEVQLKLSGDKANPSIAGNVISFERRPTLFDTTDLFVYDITTNLLYQITDTPLVTEQLNDITVLPDGRVRVVWTSDEDGFDQRNIHAATFSLPGSLDTTAPTITSPANIIANATMPSGALVNFAVTAADDVGVVSLICTPPSGSVFAIGTTTVHCIASDAAGNTAGAGFNVRVKGAAEQIVDLIQLARGTTLPPGLKARLLAALQTALEDPRKIPIACLGLSLFIQLVQIQPPSVISPALKAQLIADANRIKAVLGCR